MNDKVIWDFLFQKLNNSYGVAGLMGNLYVESKLNPMLLEGKYARKFGMTSEEYTKAVNDGSYDEDMFIHDSAGYGLAQWTYWSRKQALYQFAKNRSASIGNLDMQLDYLWDELQKYKTVISTLYIAESVREASDVVVLRYEKPQHTEEAFLANRAKYGQEFYDKYAEDTMNTAKQVDEMLAEWKRQGLKSPDIVVKLANSCIGWSYVFGARGEYCTPSNRRRFYESQKKETIKSKCKNYDGSGSCSGCKWYPNGQTRFYDCRGFTYWCLLQGANIKIMGAGATSQYKDDSNWSEKGPIANMPKDKVCCVFRWDGETMAHTLLYDGNGNYIHCSGEVKKCKTSAYNATHYAIPKGLYEGGGGGGGGDVPVAQAKVIAKTGGSVNMRSKPNTSASIVMQVKLGSIVDVYEKGDDWCKVGYSDKTGYMMTKFLDFNVEPVPTPTPTPTPTDTITVNKSDLETVYSMIGKMLGK